MNRKTWNFPHTTITWVRYVVYIIFSFSSDFGLIVELWKFYVSSWFKCNENYMLYDFFWNIEPAHVPITIYFRANKSAWFAVFFLSSTNLKRPTVALWPFAFWKPHAFQSDALRSVLVRRRVYISMFTTESRRGRVETSLAKRLCAVKKNITFLLPTGERKGGIG